MLTAQGVSKHFGALVAVKDVSFTIAPGELVALIGPNGAGKSTLLDILAGSQSPTAGDVFFEGRSIKDMQAHAVNRLGIARTFQQLDLFGSMTVRDNLVAGGASHARSGFVAGLLHLPASRRALEALHATAIECLDVVGLRDRADVPAAALPAGERRLVAIARALATGKPWLLLDEPAAGLNAVEKDRLLEVVRKLVQLGKTIVFVEHDMSLVGRLARRVLVLDQGALIADGIPAEVRADPKVVEAYLGAHRMGAAAARKPAGKEAPRPFLQVEDLQVSYGGLRALKGLSLTVAPGEIVAVVGPNGAGKSTMLKSIARVVPGDAKTFAIDGVSADRFTSAEVVRAGVSLAPEGRELFSSMSVQDNLSLGRYAHSSGLGRLNFHGSQAVQQTMEEVFELFPRLRERRKQLAGTLSGGEGQMLAIGRALMNSPRLLMLDEPSLGLAPRVVEEIFERLVALRARGLAILLVEQNARAALEIADRAYVLEVGQVVAQGGAMDLLTDQRIAAAYLGNPNESTLFANAAAADAR